MFIGTEMPSLGKQNTLYVNKTNKEISVWDETINEYIVVADKTDIKNIEVSIETATQDDINSLF